MDAIAYREGSAADLDAVMQVMDEAFDAAFGEAWTAAQCLGILNLPGVWLTVASDRKGEPAGFALCRAVVDEAELLLLGVRPAFRRRGIADALLARAVMFARVAGARRLHLEVRSTNEAVLLYKRAGFIQIGRRPAYYRGKDGQLFDALSFALLLEADDIPRSGNSPK